MGTPTNQELKDQLDDLQVQITNLKKSLDGAAKSSERLGASIGETSNLVADAAKRMTKIGQNSVVFAKSIEKQYKAAELLAESYKKTSINVGISTKKQQEFGKSFIKSVEIAQRLGAEVGDVETAITAIAEQSGRARIVTPEEVGNVIALEKATGLVGESAAKLMERMDFMGKSSEASMTAIKEIFKDSQKLGLNASKVTKVLSDNFSSMQNMSFRGGVKGMTQMAQLAVKMRMDVGEMLSMADKFYEPEAAIEAVANLQMLGGDVADAFGDPFEIMYLARNKPEELAQKVADMTENMMSFNKETGEYDFPPEARMQLKAAGDQLNINTDNMIDMARQASKIKDIKMDVGFGDEESREGIANLARLNKEKKWVVDFDGKEIEIGDTDGIKKAMEEGILEVPTTSEDAILLTAKEAMTTNKYLEQIDKSLETRFLGEANVYMAFEDTMEPIIDEWTKGTEKIVDQTIEAFNSTDIQKNIDKMFSGAGLKAGTFTKSLMGAASKDLENALGKIKEITVEDAKITIQKLLRGEKEDVSGVDNKGKPNVTPEHDVASVGGGNRILSGGFGDFSLDNRDLVIAGKPQNLLGGSGGGDTIKVEPITMTINGDLTLNAPNGSTNIDLDMESIKGVVTKMITDSLNGANYSGGKVGSSLNTA
jgi:hypothetical protein